jgi:hypothetical protein
VDGGENLGGIKEDWRKGGGEALQKPIYILK